MSQTLNTATVATGLTIANNVTTGDIGIANGQTSGVLDIGVNSSRSGQLTIGGDASTAPLRLESGTGGIFMQANNGGNATLQTSNASGVTHLDAHLNGTVNLGNTIAGGSIVAGQNLTTGAIEIGGALTTGSIDIGANSAAASTITIGGNADANIAIDTTGDITIGASSGEGVINIGTGTTVTGNINIGSGDGSVGVDIDSGPTDLVNIGTTGGTAIGNNPTGTRDITIGHATASGNVEILTTGNHNITAAKVRVLDTSQATTLTNGSAEFKGGVGITKNVVVGENVIIGQDIRADDLTRDLLMFNGNTTGSISMGGGMTTAGIHLGASGQTGQVTVLSTADATTTTLGTGALDVKGGASIEKELLLGKGITFLPKSSTIQTTSNTTTVIANARVASISTWGDAIGAHTNITFTVTNSQVVSNSLVLVFLNGYTGNGAPIVHAESVSAGSFVVGIRNGSNSNINDSMIISFIVF